MTFLMYDPVQTCWSTKLTPSEWPASHQWSPPAMRERGTNSYCTSAPGDGICRDTTHAGGRQQQRDTSQDTQQNSANL